MNLLLCLTCLLSLMSILLIRNNTLSCTAESHQDISTQIGYLQLLIQIITFIFSFLQ